MSADTPNRGLFFRVFPSVCLPMFLAAVDQTIVATALPAIAGTLGDVERISWVVVSYLMATTIAAPVYGRLGDALGRKRLMYVALGVFIAASVACAAAPSLLWLVAARVLQGLGGGGLMTLSQALVGEVVPPRERGRYQGYLAGIFMTASTFGPVAGGWLTQHLGWQSVFWVNLPLGLLAVVLVGRLPAGVRSDGRVRFDWLGLMLFSGFVGPLLLALERGQQIAWSAVPWVVGLVAVAAGSLVLLLRQERRVSQPLIPVQLLRMPAIWRADAMAACAGATIVASVTFMPIYLQVVRGAAPSEVGLLLLPLTAGVAIGALFTGRAISRTGRTAVFPSVGLVLVTACLLFLAFGAGRVGTGWLSLVFLIQAMSLGTTMSVVNTTVQTVAGPANLGQASASVQFSRSIGAALGTATVGAVLFAVLTATNPATAALFAEIVQRGPTVLAGLDAVQRAAAAAEIGAAFRAAFLTIGAFAGVAAALAWTLPVRRI